MADTIIPGAGNPLAWDRYSYVTNNPINLKDPSGHLGCTDVPTYYGIQAACYTQTIVQTAKTPDVLKKVIMDQFGVEMKDGNVKWSIDNLRTAFNGLNMINDRLNGGLKEMVKGSVYEITDGGNQYYGLTEDTGVTYHVLNGNTKIPLINFLHETGHLIDLDDVFSGPLKAKKPDWVDSTGFVDETLLLGKINQAVQSKYILKDGKQTEAFDPDEYWADAFANYIIGNINLAESTGNGRIMYDYVHGALNP